MPAISLQSDGVQATTTERLESFFSSDNQSFIPDFESHVDTTQDFAKVLHTTSSIAATDGGKVKFDLPINLGQMLHTIWLYVPLRIYNTTGSAIASANVTFRNRAAQRLMKKWEILYYNKSIDSGTSMQHRIMSSLFLNREEFEQELLSFGNDTAVTDTFASNTYNVPGTSGSTDFYLRVEVPWWGKWGTDRVLPIQLLRTPPTLEIDLNPTSQTYSSITAGTRLEYSGHPHLVCHFYSMSRANFLSTFPYTNKLSWPKPDWQMQAFENIQPTATPTSMLRIQGINQVVQSFVVLVRDSTATDTFATLRGIKNLQFTFNSEPLHTRSITDGLDGGFILGQMRHDYYHGRNGEDMQTLPSTANTRAFHAYAIPLGMKADIRQFGWGTLNTENTQNDMRLKIVWDTDTASNYNVLGKTLTVTVYAICANVVTYLSGDLWKQAQM